MIQLTRLNNKPLIVNSELIEFIENMPDTVLTLITGDKVVVRESPDEIMEKILEFRQRVLRGTSVPVAALPSVVRASTSIPPAEQK